MVGRVGLFRASCPPPLRGRFRFATTFKFTPGELVEPTTIRFATTFKFTPGELVEPTTIGLKVRNRQARLLIYQ